MKTPQQINAMIKLLSECGKDIDDLKELKEIKSELQILTGVRSIEDFRDEPSYCRRAAERAIKWRDGKKPDSILFV